MRSAHANLIEFNMWLCKLCRMLFSSTRWYCHSVAHALRGACSRQRFDLNLVTTAPTTKKEKSIGLRCSPCDVWWWCRHNQSMQCGEWQLAAGYKFIMHPIKAVCKNKFDFVARACTDTHTHTLAHTVGMWYRGCGDVLAAFRRHYCETHTRNTDNLPLCAASVRTWIISDSYY